MNVVHISQRYYPAYGGSENYFRVISEYLATQNNNVTVFTTNADEVNVLWDIKGKKFPSGWEEINKVNVLRFPVAPWYLGSKWINKAFRVMSGKLPNEVMKYFSYPPTCVSMLRYIEKKNIDCDVVHVSPVPYFPLWYSAWSLSKKSGAKLFITPFIHLGFSENDPIRKKYLIPESVRFYRDASKIFVQTEAEEKAIKNLCLENGVILEEDVFENSSVGVYLDEFKKGDRNGFRSKHGISDDEFVVFYVGSRTYDKGAITLVEAMSKVFEKTKKVRLVLAGAEMKDFTSFWKGVPSSVKDRIVKLDRITDQEKFDILEAGDLLVMASKTESFGIVYLEAWGHRKPVIGARSPAVSEIVTEDKDGILVDFGDSDQLASAILKMIGDESMRISMADYGFRKVTSKYSWDVILQRIDDVYSKAVKN